MSLSYVALFCGLLTSEKDMFISFLSHKMFFLGLCMDVLDVFGSGEAQKKRSLLTRSESKSNKLLHKTYMYQTRNRTHLVFLGGIPKTISNQNLWTWVLISFVNSGNIVMYIKSGSTAHPWSYTHLCYSFLTCMMHAPRACNIQVRLKRLLQTARVHRGCLVVSRDAMLDCTQCIYVMMSCQLCCSWSTHSLLTCADGTPPLFR